MKRYRQVSAFIVAGGASSRMRRDKGLLELGGLPLIVRTSRLVAPLVRQLTIVGPPERYAALGLHAVPDRDLGFTTKKGRSPGPLAGIATALTLTRTPWNLILACDLPYLTAEWLDWLLARASGSRAHVVMPQTARGLEPLAAVYRRECAAPIIASFGRGIRKITDALAGLRVELVSARDWRKADPAGRVLTNMNTPADYKEARRILGDTGAM